MVAPKDFVQVLADGGVFFYAGVPDSLLKPFCTYLNELDSHQHIIAVNEGTAVSLATGVHLATGTVPLVYMQNSGLGNTVNPLLSLADPEVYSIPLVLLIGWRGEPGKKDEPQHVKQGRVTPALLKAMEIPYALLSGDADEAAQIAQWAVSEAKKRSGPVAILAHKGVFDAVDDALFYPDSVNLSLTRESAISTILDMLHPDVTVVSTTGMISRELYEQRVSKKQGRDSDFLTVGSMGHASQIAMGIALSRPDQTVVCLDGDGASLMHLGGLATIGTWGFDNFLHVLLNNAAHDSVGGQPTVGFKVSLTMIANACGYTHVAGPVTSLEAIKEELDLLTQVKGCRFLEVRVRPGARPDVGRPKETPIENKKAFMKRLRAPSS